MVWQISYSYFLLESCDFLCLFFPVVVYLTSFTSVLFTSPSMSFSPCAPPICCQFEVLRSVTASMCFVLLHF